MERAQNGDREAFGRLAEEVWPRLYRLALSFLKDHQAAEDIAQETLIRAWKSLPSFRGDASFQTWVLTIGANLSKNRLKRSREAPGNDTHFDQMESHEALPDLELLQKDEMDHLKRCLLTLRPVERASVEMVIRDELSYPEAARILNLPVGTVKTHVHRARQKLKEMLSESPMDPKGGRGIHAVSAAVE